MKRSGQLTGGMVQQSVDGRDGQPRFVAQAPAQRSAAASAGRWHALQGAERGASLTQRLLAFARQQICAVPVDLRALISGMGNLLERSLGRVALTAGYSRKGCRRRGSTAASWARDLNLAVVARRDRRTAALSRIKVAEFPGEEERDAQTEDLSQAVRDRHRQRRTPDVRSAIEPFFFPRSRSAKAPGSACRWCMAWSCSSAARCSWPGAIGKAAATMVLPVRPRRPKPKFRRPRRRRSSVRRGLFVDDDPFVLRVVGFTEMLEGLSHRVIGANSGLHALDIRSGASSARPDDDRSRCPGPAGIEPPLRPRAVRPSFPVCSSARRAARRHPGRPAWLAAYHRDQLR